MGCWADSNGNCAGKTSREHLVSASLFPGKLIMVRGFPWCKDAPVEIGISGLTAKILCRKHNSDLSPLDEAASNAFETLRKMTTLNETRRKIKPNIWTVKEFVLDGALLERWFLKTLINIACDREYPIGNDSETVGRPSPRLVRIALSQQKFEQKAGLYVLAKEGMTLSLQDRVQCLTLQGENNRVKGALFGFGGFGFLLYLETDGPEDSLGGVSFGGKDLGDAKLLYRDSSFRTRVGKYESHVLRIAW
jgi:hypothetical protein